jgi:phage shock protein E
MKKIYFLLILVLVFASCQAQENGKKLVSPEVFQSKVESGNVQLIDVRTPKEFKQGHLKNAKNMHLYDQDFGSQIDKLDKKETVYVYCKAGGRSAEAVEIMQNHGFENIVELDGGTDSWTENGKPLEQ